jgi:hypothetical protein
VLLHDYICHEQQMVMNPQDNHHREHFVSSRIFLLDDFVAEVDLQHVSDYLNVYHHEVTVMIAKIKKKII